MNTQDDRAWSINPLDEAERRAYRAAACKLTELGEWDEVMLHDEIAGLLAKDFDLTATVIWTHCCGSGSRIRPKAAR